MHRRPGLKEALSVLESYAALNVEAAEVLQEYKTLCLDNQEFFAARLVVEIVDHFYHINGIGEVSNG